MWQKAATKSEISPGNMKTVSLSGRDILVSNIDGEYYAIGALCTHLQCDLGTGYIKDKTVICPCHGTVFDLTSGKVLAPPAEIPEPTYEVKVEGGDVYVDVE